MSLGKMIKKLVAEVNQKTNYGGVQELPMYGIGYAERMQYNEGGQTMYGKDKKKGMMYGGMSREKKMGGGRSMYNNGGYASVQDMEKMCSTKSPRNSMK